MVLERIFNRYLTLIAIGVASIGIALALAGPVHTAWVSHLSTSIDDQASSPDQLQPSPTTLSSRNLIAFTTVPDRPRKSVTTYTAQTCDTFASIADEFGISAETILWSNRPWEDGVYLLQPGMELVIFPADGVYYTAGGSITLEQIAAEYRVDIDTILDYPYNDLAGYTADQAPPWGMKIFVPGGQPPDNPFTIITFDDSTNRIIPDFMPGMGGSCPTKTYRGNGTGLWTKPLRTYEISQKFSSGYPGVALDAPVETPVYAADSGMVIFSGEADLGYGTLVVIDHSGARGWTTYYANLSSTMVECGDIVERGQTIGQVGSGDSCNEPHLHFELRWNHWPTNPAGFFDF